MVAIRVNEHTQERPGRLGEQYEREWIRVFTVVVTSPRDGAEVAMNARGIPRYGAPYIPPSGGYDLGSWCREITADPTESNYVWKVTCRYSNKRTPIDPAQPGQNPTLQPPDISYTFNRVSQPALYDRTGFAIVNSAGEAFDPPVEEDEKRLAIRISKNQLNYLPSYYWNFIDTINSDKWFGFPRGTVKCVGISANLKWEGNFKYWRVDYQFEMKQARIPRKAEWGNGYDKIGRRMSVAWTKFVLDRGFRERDDNDRLIPILNPNNGLPVAQPAMLDGFGRAIPLPSNKRVKAGKPGGAAADVAGEALAELDEELETDKTGSMYNNPNPDAPTDDGESGIASDDPVFLGYNLYPTRRFAALGIF